MNVKPILQADINNIIWIELSRVESRWNEFTRKLIRNAIVLCTIVQSCLEHTDIHTEFHISHRI